MRVHVRFFALARDRAGVSEASIELPDGATIALARERIQAAFPGTADLLPRVAFAVNQAYAQSTNTILHDDDELAVIPPVSGG